MKNDETIRKGFNGDFIIDEITVNNKKESISIIVIKTPKKEKLEVVFNFTKRLNNKPGNIIQIGTPKLSKDILVKLQTLINSVLENLESNIYEKS